MSCWGLWGPSPLGVPGGSEGVPELQPGLGWLGKLVVLGLGMGSWFIWIKSGCKGSGSLL